MSSPTRAVSPFWSCVWVTLLTASKAASGMFGSQKCSFWKVLSRRLASTSERFRAAAECSWLTSPAYSAASFEEDGTPSSRSFSSVVVVYGTGSPEVLVRLKPSLLRGDLELDMMEAPTAESHRKRCPRGTLCAGPARDTTCAVL